MILRRSLLESLLPLLERIVTQDGHLAQIVSRERRGNCLPPSKGCTPQCLQAQADVAELRAYLNARATTSPVAARAARRLFSPPARRARAAPGRSLPPVLVRRRSLGEEV